MEDRGVLRENECMTNPQNSEQPQRMKIKPSEPEHSGSGWTHPYVLYIIGTVVLALFLVFMGWMASQNGWIPTR